MTSFATQPQRPQLRNDRLGSRLVPLMGTPHLERILAAIPEGGRVLEWGLGGSTVYFAKRLPRDATLLSIDHHAQWADRVRDALRDEAPRAQVEVRCVPASGPLGPGNTEAEEDPTHFQNYIHAPDGQKFDVILVDGWARSACLRHAPAVLRPGGTVFLHDAQRPWYDEGKAALTEHGCIGSCPEYPGPMLWWGSTAEHAEAASTASIAPEPDDPSAYPVIVSYYTLNTPYEDEVKHLRESCERLGLDHDIRGLPGRGSWEANCAMKAQVISEAWYRHQRPVLWVDADGMLRRRPVMLAQTTCDFAIHKRALETQPAAGRCAFQSGTLYFGQTPMAEELLGRWQRRCEAQPEIWDQISLDAAWESMVLDRPLHTLWLPPAYCKITGERHDPVIEHQHASQRHHGLIQRAVFRPPQLPRSSVVRARAASRPRTHDELGESTGHDGISTSTQLIASLNDQLRQAIERLGLLRTHRRALLGQLGELRWRLLNRCAAEVASRGFRTISLYGAGRHTDLVARAPWSAHGLKVVSILDDHPARDHVAGVPVVQPLRGPVGDAIVISSDAQEQTLLAAAIRHFGVTKPILPIYGSLDERLRMLWIEEAKARWMDFASMGAAKRRIIDLAELDSPEATLDREAANLGSGELLVVAPVEGSEVARPGCKTYTRSSLGLLVDRRFVIKKYFGQLYKGEPRTHELPAGVYALDDHDAPTPDWLLVLARTTEPPGPHAV